MTPRQLRWLADGIAGVSLTFIAIAEWMAHRLPENRMGLAELAVTELAGGTLAFVCGFGAVGWLLARRRPGNAVGWSFAIGGLMWAAGGAGGAWTDYAVAGSGDVSALTRVVMNMSAFSWLFSMPFSVQLPLLLLPNGRLLTPRWRAAVAVLALGVVLGCVGFATAPGLIDGTDPARHLVNPLGVRWLGPVPVIVGVTGAGLLLAGMAAGAVSVVLRFRRSRGMERQQMRWVAAGGCGVLFSPLAAFTPGLSELTAGVIGSLGILAVPVCKAGDGAARTATGRPPVAGQPVAQDRFSASRMSRLRGLRSVRKSLHLLRVRRGRRVLGVLAGAPASPISGP